MSDGTRRGIVSVVLFALLAALLAGPVTAVDSRREFELAADSAATTAIAAERAAYGLPTDRGSLDRLSSSSNDVGSATWGIAMTAEEEAEVDIAGRMAFADDVSHSVVPVISRMPTYAGEWIDQKSDGSLVVLLTDVSDATHSQIEALMPAKSRGLRIQQVTHTYAQLVEAVDVVREAWGIEPKLLSIGVDTMNNGVDVEVISKDRAAAIELASKVSSDVGVPVRVDSSSESAGGDVACTDRDHCTEPMKAGNIMRGGSASNSLRCTVAFHIVFQGDVQALSAGHCSYYYDLWYHQGYGSSAFANVQQSLWKSGGRDILRMSFPDVQASESIYGTTYGVMATTPGAAILNETLCVSLGFSNRKDCGRVEHTSVRYFSDTTSPGFYVWGGDLVKSDIFPYPIDGDSGSPVFRERFVTHTSNYWLRTAIGVLTTEHAEYARLDNTLSDWDATIFQE